MKILPLGALNNDTLERIISALLPRVAGAYKLYIRQKTTLFTFGLSMELNNGNLLLHWQSEYFDSCKAIWDQIESNNVSNNANAKRKILRKNTCSQ